MRAPSDSSTRTAPVAPDPVTSWTLIERAAGGSAAARADFCRRYLPVVRAYLSARWGGTPRARHAEDAEQEVFLRCLRAGGLIARAAPDRGSGFGGYLYGLTRNVAREFEARDARSAVRAGDALPPVERIPAREDRLTRVFDRAFARAVMRDAAELLRARAQAAGRDARRRVELLRLRFEEDLPVRAIAARWSEPAERLHHEYARARQEFERALEDAAAEHLPDRTPAAVRAWCARMLELLR